MNCGSARFEASGSAMPDCPLPRGEARCHATEIGELYAGQLRVHRSLVRHNAGHLRRPGLSW
jgi:hypothetical protein